MSIGLQSRRSLLLPGPWARNELWRRARAVPSLDLRFAESKSLTDAVTGQSLVTFTRASSATYVDSDGLIKTAAANEARFDHNPSTGESLGLLAEEARTNLLTYSEQFDNAAWDGTYNLTISANATTAPDGTTTAEKCTPTTTNATHSAFQTVAGTISGTYTFSVYAKAGGYNKLEIFIDGASSGGLFGSGSAIFDLSTQTISSINGSASIQALPGGWYRCIVTGTSASAVTVSTGFQFYDNSGNKSFAGNGTDGIFLWGAQLEAGAFPTSYIPTTSSQVTRSADVVSITGSNFSSWYNQSQGSFFVNVLSNNTLQGGVIGMTNSFNTDLGEGFYLASSRAQLRAINYLDQDSMQNDIVMNSPLSGFNKIAVAGSTSDATTNPAFNGQSNGTVNASRPQGFGNVAGMKIGSSSNQYLTGIISRLTFWPTRLTDATLQTITQ